MTRRHWAELPRWQRVGTLVLAPADSFYAVCNQKTAMLFADAKAGLNALLASLSAYFIR
jgi:hypothetical protein